MFYRLKYLVFIVLSLLLFACSQTEQQDADKTRQSLQFTNERNRSPLLRLDSRKQAVQLT